jgi:hypothetical protein
MLIAVKLCGLNTYLRFAHIARCALLCSLVLARPSIKHMGDRAVPGCVNNRLARRVPCAKDGEEPAALATAVA